jgi:hypothetical protein
MAACAGANGFAFVVPTLAATAAARMGHPLLWFGGGRQEQGWATRQGQIVEIGGTQAASLRALRE